MNRREFLGILKDSSDKIEVMSLYGTPDKIEKILKVVEAAKFVNYCPTAGGYKDGRSVEDCYEDLQNALTDYFGVYIETPMEDWITEEELEKILTKQL